MLGSMSTLTATQRLELRSALEHRKEALLVALDAVQRAHLLQAADPDDRSVDEPEEQAERLTGEALSDVQARHDHDELVLVRAALQRLDDGTFGACLSCGKTVGLNRLLAYPAAARCIACQSKFEKK